MKTGYLLILLMLMTTLTAFGQRDRKNDSSDQQNSAGVLYTLPRTGIRIHVKATRKQFFHGPYYQYAKALLGLDNAPSSDNVKWEISSINAETFSEPDPRQVYTVHGKAATLMTLTPAGIPASQDGTPKNQDGAVSVSSFLTNPAVPDYPFPDLSMESFTVKPDSASKNVIVTKSLEDKAREAAHTITRLRKRRFKTLANVYTTHLPDGESYRVMVKQLTKLENNYVALFIGRSVQESYDYVFDYVPGDQSVSGDVLFRFSDAQGVLPKNNLSGKPIVIDLEKEDDLATAQQKQKTALTGSALSGLYYRIPGMAALRILDGVHLMATCRIAIDQYGTVVPVPDQMLEMLDRISFYPATGEIRELHQK